MSIPLDSFFISQCFCNGLPQHDSGILDRVVAVYLQISGNFDSQIKKSMSCKAGKHMVKETDTSRKVSLSCSVQIQCHLDLCLLSHDCRMQLCSPSFSPPLQNVHGSNWHAQSAVPLLQSFRYPYVPSAVLLLNKR